MDYTHKLMYRARELRRDMTPQERHLWYDFLRGYPVKFYRQKVIGGYIADFYCHAAKLVIELDGGQHYENAGMDSDATRDRVLKEHGLRTLRFSNIDVNENFQGVCQMIDLAVQPLAPPTGELSPAGD